MLDNLTGGRLDMGLGRSLRPPEFEAFGVDQQQSREMFLESFDIIRRVWADENFVHRGKYWTVRKDAPLSPPLVQRPHPPFLVSAQSEESLCWAAEHDIPFAQIDATVEQARHDQAFYREVQTAHGHAPVRRLYLMREIYVGDNDAHARVEARSYLLQYWELWNRYTQFTRGGKLPDSYDFWRRQAPMLHAMSFDEIVANDMVVLLRGDGGERHPSTLEPARPDGPGDDLQARRHALRHGRALDDHLRRKGGAEDPPCSRPRCRRLPHGRRTGTTHQVNARRRSRARERSRATSRRRRASRTRRALQGPGAATGPRSKEPLPGPP